MDKEALTRGGAGPVGLPEGDVEIPGIGTVRVRGMNRGEVLRGNRLNENDGQLVLERYVLASCMLDPRMSVDDVAAWQESGAAMECQPVLHKINELSGIGKGAEKSGVPGAGDES